jgi:ESCRT-I complex subunit TSG101
VNLLDEEDNESGNRESMHIDTSDVSSSPAPPPPRPPNPELLAIHDRLYTKIDLRLAEISSNLAVANQRLEVLSSDLDRGLPAIEDEMARLRAVRDVCQITGDRLSATLEAAKNHMAELDKREEPDSDTIILATSIVGNQLVDLIAEDNAIEDTMYHLARALNTERIDTERFLKQTRMLARDQFMKRALAHKISEGMGWS